MARLIIKLTQDQIKCNKNNLIYAQGIINNDGPRNDEPASFLYCLDKIKNNKSMKNYQDNGGLGLNCHK